MANNLTVIINAKNNTKSAFNEVKQSVSGVADATKQRLDDLSRRFERINNSGKPLRRQMREIKDLMAQMNLEGLDKSDVFLRIAQRAGEVKDAIDDAEDAMTRFADDDFNITAATQALSALAGAGSVATSAMALLGTENENVQQAILKVQGALGLLNGVQAIATALNQDSALTMKLRSIWSTIAAAATTTDTAAMGANTVATTANTAASKAWNVTKAVGKALLGDFTGLVIVGAAALGTYALATSGARKEEQEQQKQLDKLSDTYNDKYASSLGSTISLYYRLQTQYRSLRTEHAKTDWIEKNKTQFDSLGLSIDGISDAESAFVANTPTVIRALVLRARAAAKAALAQEKYQDALKGQSVKVGDKAQLSGNDRVTAARNGWIQTVYPNFGSSYDVWTQKGAKARNAYIEQQASKELQQGIEASVADEESAAKMLGPLSNSRAPKARKTTTPRTRTTIPRTRTTKSTSSTPKNEPAVPNSEKWYDQQIDALEKKRKATSYNNTDLIAKLDAEIAKLKEEKSLYESIVKFREHPVQPSDLKGLSTNSNTGLTPPKGGSLAVAAWQEKQVEAVQQSQDAFSTFGSEQMNSMVSTISQLNDLFDSGADSSVKMGAGISALGQSLQALGQNSAAAKAGLVLGAIGQIILGFAQASASSSKMGVWAWIAAVAAGLAVMTSTIAQLQSYATGGIIEGGSRVGDQQLARVNAGEMIINGSQQRHLWDAISNNRLGGGATVVTGDIRIKGSDLWLALSNFDNKMGRVR